MGLEKGRTSFLQGWLIHLVALQWAVPSSGSMVRLVIVGSSQFSFKVLKFRPAHLLSLQSERGHVREFSQHFFVFIQQHSLIGAFSRKQQKFHSFSCFILGLMPLIQSGNCEARIDFFLLWVLLSHSMYEAYQLLPLVLIFSLLGHTSQLLCPGEQTVCKGLPLAGMSFLSWGHLKANH